MLHKKKKKPLNTFMLHSKSTYFYKQWSSWSNACHNIFANGFRWSSRHCEQNSGGFRLRDGANPTRSSLAFKNPYSKNAYGRLGFLKSYILPVFCSMALLLVFGVAINPTICEVSKGFALEKDIEKVEVLGEENAGETEVIATEENVTSSENRAKAAINTDTNDASVSLIVDDGVITDTILADTGATTYRSHTITVKGDNIESYTMQISAGSNGTSALQYDGGGGVMIPGAGGKKGSELVTNTWGYGWGEVGTNEADLTYYTLPEYGAASNSISNGLLESVQNIEADTVNTTKKLTFAANFGNVPDGHYTTTVMLSLAVEPKGVVFGGITDMQEMSSNICSSAKEHDSKRLRDSRDGTLYWVTKMKDGNCWMTQNLDYNGGGSKIANIKSSWEDSSNTVAQYYDPGLYVYSVFGSATTCSYPASIAECASTNNGNGWTNVAGWTASDEPNYADIITGTIKVYDAHFLIGNYYSWQAATDYTGSATPDGQNASGSVCPDGWKLPIGGEGEVGTGSYQYLLKQYGMPNGYTMTGTVDGVTYDVRKFPLYLGPSAGVAMKNGLYIPGRQNYFTTSTSADASHAYYMDIYSSISFGYNGFRKREGFSVRCVAR